MKSKTKRQRSKQSRWRIGIRIAVAALAVAVVAGGAFLWVTARARRSPHRRAMAAQAGGDIAGVRSRFKRDAGGISGSRRQPGPLQADALLLRLRHARHRAPQPEGMLHQAGRHVARARVGLPDLRKHRRRRNGFEGPGTEREGHPAEHRRQVQQVRAVDGYSAGHRRIGVLGALPKKAREAC